MLQYYFTFKNNLSRFGLTKALLALQYKIIQKIIKFEIIYILLHERKNIKRPPIKVNEELSFKIATEKDLEALMDKPEYWVDDTKLEWFHNGEICLLNYSDGEVAGYTHVHVKGQPVLKGFIQLELPDNMIYNYGGLTIPKFRGRRHHAIRHYEVMQIPQCKDKEYMMAFVNYDNFAAIQGGIKGGRYPVGYIIIYGIGRKKRVKLTKGLKKYNIKLKRLLPEKMSVSLNQNQKEN